MEQPDSAYAAPGPPAATTHPCELCGTDTKRYTLLLVDGRLVCSGCAAAANDTGGRTKVLVLAAAGFTAFMVIALVVWLATAHLGVKTEIGKSLVRLQAAALLPAANEGEKKAQLRPYLQGEALYDDLIAAATAAQDPDPDRAATGIWNSVITTAVQRGKVESVDGDQATLSREFSIPLGSEGLTTFVVEYEMRRAESGNWRITHLLNAPEIYATYREARPLTAP